MKEERVKPEGMDDETWKMAQVMGFAGFKSTKNTKVPGNDKNFGNDVGLRGCLTIF